MLAFVINDSIIRDVLDPHTKHSFQIMFSTHPMFIKQNITPPISPV